MMTRAALLSVSLLAFTPACYLEGPSSIDETSQQIQGNDDYQGPLLLGEYPSVVAGTYLHGILNGTVLTLEDGHLAEAGVPVDPSVAPVPAIPASDGGILRIVGAQDLGGGMWQYQIKHLDLSGVWNDYCKNNEAAIPTWGTWHADGDNFRNDNRHNVTFSCPSGAVYKCQDWAWSSWDQPERHHACTRMVRNDACGTGDPHTMAGTAIRQYDANDTGVNPFQDNATVFSADVGDFGEWITPAPLFASELPVDTRYFEAGWTATAWGVRKGTQYSGHAVCLSKLRWQSMPIGGNCPGTLPDPRDVETGAAFCEDFNNIQDLESLAGALLVNESLYNETPLLRWNMPGGYSFSTAYSDFQTDPDGNTGSPVADEGLVFTENGYNALINSGDYTAADFATLQSFVKPTGSGDREYATSVNPMGGAYVPYRLEGYIFTNLLAALDFESKSTATMEALYLEHDGIRWVTTTSPTTAAPVLQGYVFRL